MLKKSNTLNSTKMNVKNTNGKIRKINGNHLKEIGRKNNQWRGPPNPSNPQIPPLVQQPAIMPPPITNNTNPKPTQLPSQS